MIPKECKRFTEVDFPIIVVSRHLAREFSKQKRERFDITKPHP